MPPLPWTRVSTVAPDTPCTVMATRLPLRSYRSIPRFLLWTLRIRRQLAGSPGLVGYSLDAHLLRKTFWTVSAWTGRPELGRFNRSDPHAAATESIRPLMGTTTFLTWTCAAGELPVRWDEARRRVAEDTGARH
jgi:hypothetical protein